ncbi:centrin-1, putative [Entamoeba invadens IP1]|uniref:Centrin-1, putative n=1 Tax=Entamoeba invadens IP1 TaxID=370355 RepID=L7FQD1_ENTIV|nr:centrin-1, putative [Entamoeba invadens IP1]ELP94381.1 centrin-1, putative [Entamoeba invadens IP1]|eukprot:XP_004261152.1 centrin-1, putative [Entamoeba invadens IP1]
MNNAEQFEELDTDQNGLINFDEFITMFTDNTNQSDFGHWKTFFDLANKEENGFLTLNEFERVMTNIGELKDNSDKSLFTVYFNLIDDDNNGKIGIKQLARFMKCINTELTEEELKKALTEMDGDVDGKVNLEEMLKFLTE